MISLPDALESEPNPKELPLLGLLWAGSRDNRSAETLTPKRSCALSAHYAMAMAASLAQKMPAEQPQMAAPTRGHHGLLYLRLV